MLERAVAADARDADALAWLGSAQVRKARTASAFEAPGWVRKGFNTLDDAVERFPDTFIVYMVRGITATNVPDMFRKGDDALTTPFLALGTHDEIAEHLLACRQRWGISNFTVRSIEDMAPVIDRLRAVDAPAR